MTEFLIGINGGATHTSLVALDLALNELGNIEAGPSNINNRPLESVRETLHAALIDLNQRAGLDEARLLGVGVGLAGVDPSRPVQFAEVQAMLQGLLPGVPIILDNDGIVALVTGVGRRFGVVTISGTGSISLGVRGDQRARCGGWGYLLDQGSGYAIGREALMSAAREHDQGRSPSALAKRILAQTGLKAPLDLIGWLYGSATPDQIAQLARETSTAAETDGDLDATAILVRAADALAAESLTVARRLGFGPDPFPLVLSGGVFNSKLIRDRFVNTLQGILPLAVPIQSQRSLAIGAVLMAAEAVWPDLIKNSADDFQSNSQPVRRPTEQRNLLTLDIARRPTLDLLRLMNLEDSQIAGQIAPVLPRLAELIDAVAARFKAGGRLIMAGAGTSGRLAVLDAVECRPTFGVSSDQVIGLLAGGPGAMMGAVEGAEDSESDGAAQIAALNVSKLDSVIGIAASGSTPYVQGLLREAAERGALTGSIVNVSGGPISALAEYAINVPVGAEVIMGSTRLRAGTAEKLVLNMLTTGMMVRAGRTFGNLMTDMQASNIKLRGRARVIVAEATGLSLTEANALLDQSAGEIKTAIAAALLKLEPDQARQRLAEVTGDLNRL